MRASCACQLPKPAMTLQSCAGASNDDDRRAPGHRGRLGPDRLCDRPATAGFRTAPLAHAPLGTAPTAARTPASSSPGPGGAGDGPALRASLTVQDRPEPLGPARTGHRSARPPAPPARRPATAADRPKGPVQLPPTVSGGSRERRRVRARPQIRRVAARQPRGEDLPERLRALSHAERPSWRAPCRGSAVPWALAGPRCLDRPSSPSCRSRRSPQGRRLWGPRVPRPGRPAAGLRSATPRPPLGEPQLQTYERRPDPFAVRVVVQGADRRAPGPDDPGGLAAAELDVVGRQVQMERG